MYTHKQLFNRYKRPCNKQSCNNISDRLLCLNDCIMLLSDR